MPENDFKSQMMGSWHGDYSWPRIKHYYGARGGGKTADMEENHRVQKLLGDSRRQFWEARRDSVIVARAIEFALSEGLEEVDALLLAVGGLIQQNRELMNQAQVQLPVRGPHVLTDANGETDLCGGPGCCEACDGDLGSPLTAAIVNHPTFGGGMGLGSKPDTTVLYDVETGQNIHRWAPNMPYHVGDKVLGSDDKVHIRTIPDPSGETEPCWPNPQGWSTRP